MCEKNKPSSTVRKKKTTSHYLFRERCVSLSCLKMNFGNNKWLLKEKSRTIKEVLKVFIINSFGTMGPFLFVFTYILITSNYNM